MKLTHLLMTVAILFPGFSFVGCGGHKGGAIEVPEDNPYAVDAEEYNRKVRERSAKMGAQMEDAE